MQRTILLPAGAALLVYLSLLSSALAWDPSGHLIIAQIAYDRLNPAAKSALDRSVAAFNQEKQCAIPYTPVTAACWMDDIRGIDREYNKWHYIDLPYNLSGPPDEPPPNALWAINLCLGIIKGTQTSPGIDRDQALVMLLHLVGDIHQPLHCINHNNDAGGNKVSVTNIQDSMSAAFPRIATLHFFWDGAYRRVFRNGAVINDWSPPPSLPSNPAAGHIPGLPLIRTQCDLLLQAVPPASLPTGGDPESWAVESNTLASNIAYDKLPGGADANSVTLTQAYVDGARDCSRKRLVQAGVRLANLLNGIYGK